MKTALTDIHDTYLLRCDNPHKQKTVWRQTIAPVFPPDLSGRQAVRASVLLAGESGDLGCALLWIVQAALTQPLLKMIRRQAGLTPDHQSLLATLSEISCGALAHSEPRDKPVTLTNDSDGLHVTGVKKYITAGSQADYILVTARAPDDQKVSQLILLPAQAVTRPELIALDLKALRTTSHGRLTMENKSIPDHYHLPLSPSTIRKALKINGLIERSLILEAVLAFARYLNNRLGRHRSDLSTEETALKKLSAQQSGYTTDAINQARSGQKVEPQWPDLNAVNTTIENLCNASANMESTPGDDLAERVNDLRFIRSMWG